MFSQQNTRVNTILGFSRCQSRNLHFPAARFFRQPCRDLRNRALCQPFNVSANETVIGARSMHDKRWMWLIADQSSARRLHVVSSACRVVWIAQFNASQYQEFRERLSRLRHRGRSPHLFTITRLTYSRLNHLGEGSGTTKNYNERTLFSLLFNLCIRLNGVSRA